MRHPLSLEAFADWCEKQPADKEYNFNNCRTCAVAQYANSLGLPNPYDFPKSGRVSEIPVIASKFWSRANQAAFEENRTFSALASRLRAASQP